MDDRPDAVDANGEVVDGASVTFKSDNVAVADITLWGEIDAYSAGTVTISVTAPDDRQRSRP